MRDYKSIFSNIDWTIILLYLSLVFIGWINIYAAVYNEDHHSIFDITQRYGKQLMWIGLALLIAFAILLMDSQFFTAFAFQLWLSTAFFIRSTGVCVKINGGYFLVSVWEY